MTEMTMKRLIFCMAAALLTAVSVQTAAQTDSVADGRQLAGVVVKGRKPAFVARLDRKVFNVGQDLMSSAGSAADLLQNIPSVDVDMDGGVSLRGNGNVTILINGKPSAMMGAKTRGDALNLLSASSIERIEIITNPSAEYKPDGVSGIINIVLRKTAGQGLNGTLSANAGSYGRQNAGVNMNYGWDRLNIFGGYTFRRDRYDRSITDRRTSPADIINQTTYGLGRPVSHTIRLGMNAALTDKDRLEAVGSYNRRRFRRNERVESVTESTGGKLSEFYLRDRDALAKENMWEATLKYSHRYGKDCEWGADYAYSSESEDEINHYSTQRMKGNERNNEAVWDANYMHMARIYWQHRFNGWMKLMSGYELEHLKAEQNYHVADWDGSGFIPNTVRSSDFTHLMTLHSLYATLDMAAGQWTVTAGLRGEYADICNRLASQHRNLSQSYLNLYPTLHLSRATGSDGKLTVSYSLRVNRPEGSDMNPFAEQINPLSLEAGNPDLKPEKIHSLEAGWLWHPAIGGSLMSTLYYRYIANQITTVSRYIESGVLLTTKENLQSAQNAGIELIWSLPAARWLDFNLNANGYYSQIDASRLGFGKNKDTFSWSALLNANFRPLSHYMIQLNARYRSATLVPQGRRDADLRINLGMKYDIPAINLSLIASVTDLFDTYRKSYTLDTPELKQKVEKRRNPRIFYIGAAWQFGGSKGKRHNANVEYDEGL
ncbi:MAG: TonB-dependent receptor [Prevotella sp.]|nr:TonB-dependent receptor [Prevotella sp.]